LAFWAVRFPARPGGDELHQQLVKVVHRLGPGPDQFPASLAHQPQGDHLVVGHHLAQTRRADRDHRDRAGIARVVLAAVPDIEDPGPSRELRRHVEHSLAVGNQALRELHPDAAGALHRPGPFRPPPRHPEHVPVAGAVVADLQRRQLGLASVKHRHRVRPLRRVHPIIRCHLASISGWDGECGQTYLERSRPLSSHDPPDGGRRGRIPLDSHTLVGRHLSSDSPTT
jgi:hypothetical protein